MPFNINEMRAKLVGGGARPSLFSVNIFNPVDGRADNDLQFMVKATSIPASTLSQIEVPYFGRVMKVAGTRTYEDWSVTVINDENFSVRASLEEWSKRINTYAGNIRDFASPSPNEYKSTAEVTQYGKTGEILRVYRFNGLFPLVVSPIELNWESGNQIEEFQCSFAYDYWTVVGEPG